MPGAMDKMIKKGGGGPKIKQLGKGVAKAKKAAKAKLGAGANKASKMTLGSKMTLAQVIPKAKQVGIAGIPKPKPVVNTRHTLLLQQPTQNKASRTWSEYRSVTEAVDSFITSYEAKLRSLNPNQKQLQYTVADLHKYVDSMSDATLMIINEQTRQYAPKNKDFLKSQIMSRLRGAAK